MEITVNIDDNILVFNGWKNTNGVMRYRNLKSIEDQGIVLIVFNDDYSHISLRWFGQYMSPIHKIYKKLYSDPPKYYPNQMKEYQQHIDIFLNKINMIKVFI
jgi:hypothetical protein